MNNKDISQIRENQSFMNTELMERFESALKRGDTEEAQFIWDDIHNEPCKIKKPINRPKKVKTAYSQIVYVIIDNILYYA
jgi:hypothetical protein